MLSQHESLFLHPAVLEPDLDLLVAEVQAVGQLPPPLPGDELIQHKFTFKLGQLQLGVGLAFLSGASVHRVPWSTLGRGEGRGVRHTLETALSKSRSPSRL